MANEGVMILCTRPDSNYIEEKRGAGLRKVIKQLPFTLGEDKARDIKIDSKKQK
jgi:hypothetical protein